MTLLLRNEWLWPASHHLRPLRHAADAAFPSPRSVRPPAPRPGEDRRHDTGDGRRPVGLLQNPSALVSQRLRLRQTLGCQAQSLRESAEEPARMRSQWLEKRHRQRCPPQHHVLAPVQGPRRRPVEVHRLVRSRRPVGPRQGRGWSTHLDLRAGPVEGIRPAYAC